MSATLPPVTTRAPAPLRTVVPLTSARDVAEFGEKAATLARLDDLGFAVPAGIVLGVAAFEAHLAARDLPRHIDAILEGLDATDTAAFPRAAQAIRALIMAGPIESAIRDELLSASAPLLHAGPVVVRSSAVGEDSAHGSFAGQLDSILHVSDAPGLERALLRCWASYWSDRALFYRCVRALPLRGMGVIVQRQVDAQTAGVMFTDDGAGMLLVEYGAGLGDAVVAGAVDPGRIAIDRRTGHARVLATLGDEASGIDALMREPARVAELVAVGNRLECELGSPQDVEWAVDAAGRLHLVQSRPITTPVRAAPAPLRRRVAWSNANVNENFPDPISPLLYSIASDGYSHYFRNLARAFGISSTRRHAMEPALSRVIGVQGARMYYNLTSIHRVLRLAPFGEALADAFDTFVGARGQDATSADEPVPRASVLRQRAELLVIAVNTAWQYLWLRGRVARFERTVDEYAARTEPGALDAMPLETLRAALAGFMDIRRHRWNDAALADAASMVCYAALQRALAHALPESVSASLHTSLLKAIPDVVSSKPVLELWALSRRIRDNSELASLFATGDAQAVLERIATDRRFVDFRRQFDRYLDTWGFRCSAELMLTVPSFQEAPAPLVEMLRAYARLEGESPLDALARQAAEREAETARVLATLRGRRFFRRLPVPTSSQVVRLLIGWTHASIRFRERARLKQALLYSRCRRVALALGRELSRRELLAHPEDVFWLTVQELDEVASGGAMFPRHTRELVALRAGAHADESSTMPPDSFELDEGECWSPASGSAATTQRPLQAARSGAALSGTSACGGRATGRAAVLRAVTEAGALARGDVLVTRQTDPGWAPVFFLISGLVIERGGMLSHGAIIAREFGIPCVVGVRDATQLISAGATITVDGDHGYVYVG